MALDEHTRRAFKRYLLLELPSWAMVAAVLYGLVMWGKLATPVALGLFALWVAKDFALFPWLRRAYEDGSRDGTQMLIGALGETKERLDPEGYVRVGSELWHARVERDAEPIAAGAKVRVLAVKRLTLWVEPA